MSGNECTQSLMPFLNSSLFNKAQEITPLHQCQSIYIFLTHKTICQYCVFLWLSTYSDPLLQILQVAIPRKKGQSAN